ncbi:MAG: peptidase T [Bacteroidota bacterium]|nr:peptidase T [Bacteroidota bacterium]MDX5429532.1 peptidase T [Bacteroidota bacterium]MDX5468319.1 peptidase T [Bacteroidota bacterium]
MSLLNYQSSVAERLMRYAAVYTESDSNSETCPSTERQKDLSRMLVEELKALGIGDADMDENGYVYATIPSNVQVDCPVICFCSHVDTSADVSGENVKPRLHKNYQGQDITYPDDPSLVLRASDHPYLKERIGDDIITASGLTLLGADDKAGVAIIMDLAAYLMANPQVPHGKIRILFTPDEEIGRGVDKVDMKRLAADYGYTLDGGPRGSLEGESFSADGAVATFYGVSAHPGYAKGKMVNALKVAAHFVDLLPKETWNPETTSGHEGFVHPLHIEGSIEATKVSFIVRDHMTSKLADYEKKLDAYAKQAVANFPGSSYKLEIKEQYRNMKEVLDTVPFVMDLAAEAYRKAGLEPKIESIRGGTDGSRLSFMGLPCPNIFTGEMAIHSKLEYVSVQDMEKATEVLVHLAELWTKQTKA